MELKDLKGKHILSAVDFGEENIKSEYSDVFEHSQVCRFKLDDNVYAAIEDPDDEYRSSMRELIIDDSDKMKNTFPNIIVVGVYVTENYGSCDILKLIDIETGETVLEVGTDKSDDYYPFFVANFNPEAMHINKG